MELDQQKAISLLNYDPESGVFTRKGARGKYADGSQVGRKNCYGYIDVVIGKSFYKAHRLAWLISKGEWPVADIDHINGDRSDNRLVNLRAVSRAENMQNQAMPRSKVSGFLGVTRHDDDKWRARITVAGIRFHLGVFNTPEEVSEAYLVAKKQFHIASQRCSHNHQRNHQRNNQRNHKEIHHGT